MFNAKQAMTKPNTMARKSLPCFAANFWICPARLSILVARANLRPASTSFSYFSRYFGSSLSGIFSPRIIFFRFPMASVVYLVLLLYVLVDECAPVHYEKSVRVVIRSRYSLELPGCDELTHQDAASAFNPLTAVVGELHVLGVHPDAVTVDAEHCTGSHDVGVKSFLLEGV